MHVASSSNCNGFICGGGLNEFWQLQSSEKQCPSVSFKNGDSCLLNFTPFSLSNTVRTTNNIRSFFYGPESNWNWISGSDQKMQVGAYGVKGTGNILNTPGARYQSSIVANKAGIVYLFGGSGYTSSSTGNSIQ